MGGNQMHGGDVGIKGSVNQCGTSIHLYLDLFMPPKMAAAGAAVAVRGAVRASVNIGISQYHA